MEEEYYVIVDLEDLTYMKDGKSSNIREADKFEELEQAQEELSNYDDDFNGAIYKVKEKVFRTIKLVSKLIPNQN